MIDAQYIKQTAESLLDSEQLYVVEATVSPALEIEILLDSDLSVSVDDCVKLSRAMEEVLEPSGEDFSLTVSSAGIGQPLKLIGRPVEVPLANGTKILATLVAATDDSITVSYTEKAVVEGKKRKQEVTVEKTYPKSEIKTVREYLDFK